MANPLTLVMPLADGVDLGKLQAALDGQQAAIDKALETIGTVHFARFVVFDASSPNLQPGPSGTGPFALSVITAYDGDFDLYIQDFVNQLGPVFDALLSFTADGAPLIPVGDHLEQFTDYIAANDASQHPPNSAFRLYSAYSYTVQQILAAGSS
jgi:hypothetical protein